MVFKFLESNQILSPFLNGVNVDVCCSAMRLLASLWAARASSQLRIKVLILSSREGYFVFSNDKGIATGDSPNSNSKGVCCLSVCRRLLCVNSRVCRAEGHSSGCDAQ